jgi:hypothetical protein
MRKSQVWPVLRELRLEDLQFRSAWEMLRKEGEREGGREEEKKKKICQNFLK